MQALYMQWHQSIFCEAPNWRQPGLPVIDATFHPPWKACKDAISSTETNSMTGSDCCFDAAKQTKIQGKNFSIQWNTYDVQESIQNTGNARTIYRHDLYLQLLEMTGPIRSLDLAFFLIPMTQKHQGLVPQRFSCVHVCVQS